MTIPLRFMDWPLRAKIAGLVLAVSLVPLIIGAGLDIRSARRASLIAEADLLAARADHLVGMLDTFNRSYRQSVGQLARLPDVIAFCAADPADAARLVPLIRRSLSAWPASAPEIRGTALIDRAGVVRAATEPAMAGRILADLPEVRAALDGAEVVSAIHLAGPEVGELPTIAYLAPVRGPDGALLAAAVIWVRAEALWTLARTSNELAGPRSFAVLFDEQGIRVAHTYSESILFHPGGAITPATIDSAVARRRFGARTRELLADVRAFPEQFDRARAAAPDTTLFRGWAPVNREMNYGVARRLTTVPWTLFYMVPERSVAAPIEAMTRSRLLFTALIIALALAIGAYLARSVIRPITSLARAAEALGRGELSARVRPEGRDELGALGASFNTMAGRIQAQDEELRGAKDALERKVRERTDALRLSEENLRITLESIGDGVITADIEGRVAWMNPVAEELTGWSLGDAIRRPLADVFRILDEQTRTVGESPVTRVLRDGAVFGFANHSVLVSRDGRERVIADSGAPIRDEAGDCRGVVLVFRDQTAERAAEARKVAMFEAALDAVVMMDHTGRITELNAAGERMFGWSRAEAVGEPLGELLVPADLRESHRAGLARYLETGQARILGRRLELVAQRRGGAEFPVEVAIVRVASAGPPVFVGYIRDLTEQQQLARERLEAQATLRRTEDQLRQAQRMEAIGNLAGGIAHDFNNLLSVILGYASRVGDALGPDHAKREDLEQIRYAAKRAGELTRQLLAFGRRQVLQPKRVDLGDAVEATRKILVRTIGEDVELLTRRMPGLGLVYVDSGQVEQVLMNLVVNARDAMPDGGRITIETANVDVDAAAAAGYPGLAPGPHVMLSVTDDGTGMEPDTMTHIFEPFFTTKAIGKGTGLGLSMVFGIVKQSAGHIEVESAPGKGTTIRIRFPRTDGSAPGTAARVAAPERRGSETILLVEDDDSLRRLTRLVLEGHGYRVLVADGAEQALPIAGDLRQAIDLLITDVVMPGMNGRQLAERIRLLRPAIRVLLVSGYSDEAVLHQGALGPAFEFLQKPVMPEELLARVRALLDG